MKQIIESRGMDMICAVLAALLVAAPTGKAWAADAPAGSYTHSVGATARYVDLDYRGSRGLVQEYNGKLYYIGQGDVWASGENDKMLYDLKVWDIGSTEEGGLFNYDYKSSFKGSANWDTMSHRQPFINNAYVYNGVWTANPFVTFKTPQNDDSLFKRHSADFAFGWYSDANAARWIALDYWWVNKKGDQSFRYATGNAAEAFVDNTKHDLTVSLGHELTENGGVNLDLNRVEFRDDAFPATVAGTLVKPKYGNSQMNAGELKFRYSPSKTLAFTGAFTGRERESLQNLYKNDVVVGALNASYKPSPKLGLTARLYTRANQVNENNKFQSFNSRTNDSHQIDKTTVRGELGASYKLLEKLALKAGYKLDFNHRRDAPTEEFTSLATYQDGTVVQPYAQKNAVAREDAKHVFNVGLKAELPLDAEAEVAYTRTQANRAAFEGLPNRKNEFDGELMFPLSHGLDLALFGIYSDEQNNHSSLSNYHAQKHTYRAALDWEGNSWVTLGADYSYDLVRYITDGWFGTSNAPVAGANEAGNLIHENGMVNNIINNTAGAHVRVRLPKGVAVLGNGSYTWSNSHVNVNGLNSNVLKPYTTETLAGATVNDLYPADTRIARGTVGVEYTPEKWKNWTARASYSIDDWVDKYDPNNSGRASVSQVGLSAKF
ncbi:MAG: hypothetical protein HY079_11955 [Elusimicrobia bacterium]|nr:hypothetical protein [Elusimicrobiota bacterium]